MAIRVANGTNRATATSEMLAGAERGCPRPGQDGRHKEPALGEGEPGQRGDDVDAFRIKSYFLGRFSQSSGDVVVVVPVMGASREGDTTGVVPQVGGALSEQHFWSGGPGRDQDQDRAGPEGRRADSAGLSAGFSVATRAAQSGMGGVPTGLRWVSLLGAGCHWV